VVKRLKAELAQARIPVMENSTHIIPVMIGDPVKCKEASDMLLELHNVYVQPINYPTVPKDTERLRITPTPLHTPKMQDELVHALKQVFATLNLEYAQIAA